jgi:hypothetical protein
MSWWGAKQGPRVTRSACFFACALCFAVVLLGCQKEVHPPQRPPAVPEKAFWLGGPDGGVFVLLQKRATDPPPIYRARIYEDSSGALLYEGQLTMVPSDKPDVDTRNAVLFSFWDGQRLHLEDGRELKVVPGGRLFRQPPVTSGTHE